METASLRKTNSTTSLKTPKFPKPDGKTANLVAQLLPDWEALREMGTYKGLPLPFLSFTKGGGGTRGKKG